MELDQLITEIRKLTDFLTETRLSQLEDGDYIANLIVKLASYNVSLGHYVADLDRDADLAEAHYEIIRETAYKDARLDDSRTVADADNIKRLESAEQKEGWIEAKHQFRVASILRNDVGNLIDALRSKLSYMRQERSHS